MEIYIGDDGRARFVYDEEVDPLAILEALGSDTPMVCRASHVEPSGRMEWVADMAPVGGPVLGPFDLRSAALAAERAWLEAELARGGRPVETLAGTEERSKQG